jgi:hypothetical protein
MGSRSKTETTDTTGEAGRHSDGTISTNSLKQNQQAPRQTQHQDHSHPGEEKYSHTQTYKRQNGPKSRRYILCPLRV